MKLQLGSLFSTLLTLLVLPYAAAQNDVFDIYRSYPSCDLCGAAAAYVTRGSVFLPEGTGGILTSGVTCDTAERLASQGNLSEASCLLLGLRVKDECGCTNAGRPPASSPSSPSAPSPTRPSGSSPTRPSGSPPTRPSTPTQPSRPSAPTPTNPTAPSPSAGGGTLPTEDTTPIMGMAFVRLDPITGGSIPDDELPAINRACAAFLDAAIPTISGVSCISSVVDSSRRLRALQDATDGPVEIELIVSATSTDPEETMMSFSEKIQNAINGDRDGFIAALQNESSFFDTVTSVNSDIESPVSAPDDGLSNGAIAGIAFGSAFAFLLLIVLVYFVARGSGRQPKEPSPSNVSRSFGGPFSGIPRNPASAKKTPNPKAKTTLWNPPTNTAKPSKIPVASAAAVATAAHGSTDPESKRAASLISDDSFTDQSLTDGSTMSSLRPEMQSRVVQAPSGKLGIVIDTTLDGPVIHRVNDNSPLVGQLFPGDVIVAVNNIDTRAMSAQAITSLMARTSSGRRTMTVLSSDVSDDSTPRRSGATEESEDDAKETIVAANPPVNANEDPSTEEPIVAEEVPRESEVESTSVQDEDDIASVASSLRSDMQPRIVKAPPGKLGIVIDTTQEGPMVNEIKEGSKLAGLVQVGDIIAKVNDVDTRAMSGAAITSLMVRTARQTRVLTVLGKDYGK